MVNKKAMLLASETLKLIIAVISIGFLIYLLSAIYFSNVQNKEKVQAEATMERIGEIVDRLGIGEISSELMTEITPFGWNIFAFTEEEKKPNLCAGENCLCFCEKVSFDDVLIWKDRQLRECDEGGVCLVVSKLREFESLEIGDGDSTTSLSISKKGDLIEVKEI